MKNFSQMELIDRNRNEYIATPEDTVLVTGANGFVGSRVVRALLSNGYKKIRCLTRATSKSKKLQYIVEEFGDEHTQIVKGNLLSPDDCLRITDDVSVIYHLAAGVGKSYGDCFFNSVVTTRNLLEATLCNNNFKRFVNISSIAVYSNEKKRPGSIFDEEFPLDDKLIERHEPYTYGKMKQDTLVVEYAKKYNLPYVIVRPSVVFGPGKAKITSRVGSDTFGIFLHLGLGNRIPFTYVDNCADAIFLAGLTKGINGEVFNIFDDDLPRSREFLKLYKCKVCRFFSIPVPHWLWRFFCSQWGKYSKWSGGQLPPVFNRRAYSVYWKDHEYSNRKAKKLLGWQPKVPMSEALEFFFEYIREEEKKK